MNKMKKRLAVLSATAMALASLTVASLPVSATSNANHVYGDANNDGTVSIADVVAVLNALNNSGKSKLSLSEAAAYVNFAQAADVSGDGYITSEDATMIQNYLLSNGGKVGRCGQTF